MPTRRDITFGDFHLDPGAKQLRHRGVVCPLRPKSFSVLWHLASNPGRLIPQDELMRVVWPGTTVGPTVLRVSIREIRTALGDAAHLLVTLPRQGHRFVLDGDIDTRLRPFVGREAELSGLHRAFQRARSGARQVVFVTGDAGVGKSRLVERFLDDVRAAGGTRIATGQCVELHDGLEPYAPLLDLLDRMRRSPDGDAFDRMAARSAPSWLRQISGEAIAGTDLGSEHAAPPSRGQLLRELSLLLEELAGDMPLIVKLQDLHWTDASTLEVLSYLAQRDQPAALLIVCTRRADVGTHVERLEDVRRQLLARHRASEIRVGMLGVTEVESFLCRRLAPTPLGKDVAAVLYARTSGHPLFLTALTDHLLAQRQLVINEGTWRIVGSLDGVIPTAIREMIATVFDTIPQERRRILEAASVAGSTFSAAAICAALDLPLAEVEEACDLLVADRRLAHGGIERWPDGTTSARYAFLHEMHAEVLYAGLSPAVRSRYHRLVGETVSSAHAGQLRGVAALLAHHFTLAGEDERAWYAHRQAARAARDALAAREALGHLEAALTMIRALPRDEKRSNVELRCLLELGEATIAVHGYAAASVAGIYERACEIANVADDASLHAIAESGRFVHHAMRGELATAQERAREIVQLAERAPMLLGTGHGSLGAILLSRGELLTAQDHFRRASDAWQSWPGVALDLRAILEGFQAICGLVRGSFRDTKKELARMLQQVAEMPFDALLISQCETMAAFFHAARGATAEAGAAASRAIALADAHGLPLYLSPRVVYGWATNDVAAIRAEMARVAECDVRLGLPQYGALLAEASLHVGDAAGAAEAVDRALVDASVHGENYYLAELHRLRGRCQLLAADTAPPREQRSLHAMAQESFEGAMAIARDQGARLWLLRAASDAVASAPRVERAREVLRELLHDIDDGSAAPDLVRARKLLADA